MGWDGMGWDGMGWDGMGWDGINTCVSGKVDARSVGGRETEPNNTCCGRSEGICCFWH